MRYLFRRQRKQLGLALRAFSSRERSHLCCFFTRAAAGERNGKGQRRATGS
jgi:hypothetical protein